MDTTYFIIAIVSGWVLGVLYLVAAFMVVIGFRISRPAIEQRLFNNIQYLFALVFVGMSIHYLHLGYHGAVHGILPSQESLLAAGANLLQLVSLPTVLFIALVVRFKTGPIE
jgi:hypothetical protein